MRRIFPKHQRIILVIIATLVSSVIVGVYTFWSMSTWKSYAASYEGWHDELKVSVDKTIGLPVTTPVERSKKLTDLKNVSLTIDTAKQSLCRVPILIEWQRVIGDISQRQQDCKEVVDRTAVLGVKIHTVTNYMEDEQTLATVLTKTLATSKDKVTEATWDTQPAIWQSAHQDIAKIVSTEEAFTSVKTSAVEKIKAVESAWRDILSAHKAKDKAKYGEAQLKLMSAYDALSSLSVVSGERLAQLTMSLQEAYQRAFDSQI